jgi:hypothetical protein
MKNRECSVSFEILSNGMQSNIYPTLYFCVGDGKESMVTELKIGLLIILFVNCPLSGLYVICICLCLQVAETRVPLHNTIPGSGGGSRS